MAHASTSDRQSDFKRQALSLREVFWRITPPEPTARVRELFKRDVFGSWGPIYHLNGGLSVIVKKVAKASGHSEKNVWDAFGFNTAAEPQHGRIILYRLQYLIGNKDPLSFDDLLKIYKKLPPLDPLYRSLKLLVGQDDFVARFIQRKDLYLNEIMAAKREFRGILIVLGKQKKDHIALQIDDPNDAWEQLMEGARVILREKSPAMYLVSKWLKPVEYPDSMGLMITVDEKIKPSLHDLFKPIKKSFTWVPVTTQPPEPPDANSHKTKRTARTSA